MRWVDLGTTVLRYDVTGAGPPLVLIHEMGGTLNSWDAVVPLLAGRTVVRLDLRGAGLSEKASGQLALEDLVGDIAGLLDHLAIREPVALAGMAVGAAIALRFAQRSPARTEAVIGFSPVTACPLERREAVLAHAARIEGEGLRALAPASIPNILPEVLRTDDAAFQAARCRWLANDPRSFAAIYRMFAHLDLTADLPGIATPALMVGATHDGLRPPADVEAVARRLPRAEYRELPTGHIAAVQTPELAARTTLAFLAAQGR